VTSIFIVRLGAGDAEPFRAIRLEALRLHPDCFCADLETVEAMTAEEWVRTLDRTVWLGAKKAGALVAIAAFSRPASKKLAHTGELSGMYARDGERGTGLADALLRAVIDHAVCEVEQLKLTVNANNQRAVRLYERHGFRTVGRIPRRIRVGDETYDEIIMLRSVSTSD
jgi:ribosomal protein S18 acetylase RimI-like enzyme